MEAASSTRAALRLAARSCRVGRCIGPAGRRRALTTASDSGANADSSSMAQRAINVNGAKEGSRPRRTIFSGIQPTGTPHLGNYLGALQNWVKLQDEATANGDSVIFSIVGLHAITMPQDPKQLRRERKDMLASLLAIGLDPERSILFHQDQVQEHAELAWYLNCLTSVGRLNRMTTWKSKLATARGATEANEADRNGGGGIEEGGLALGLFAYPVLQAADILLYRATHVPVGEDQVQHLELSRDIAELFNRTYKQKLFPPPQHIITPTKRVLSLRDPTSKMSKSAPDASSRILITDPPNVVRSKVKRAVTDSETEISYDPEKRPGVSNLLGIASALMGRDDPTTLAEELNREGGGAGTLKAAVSDAIIESLRPIQDRLQRIQSEPAYLAEVEKKGRERAREKAIPTMEKVRRLVGLSG